MKKIIATVLVAFCITNYSNAQETGEDDLGFWAMYFGTNRISERLSIHTEAQFRFYEVASNFNQMLLRTGLNYDISDKAMVTLGYGYIETDTSFPEFDGEQNSTENRIYQQFVLRNSLGKFKFSHRYRIEQRFLSSPSGNETQHRARYFLRVTYPVTDTWFLTAYDEIFINLQEPLFGQNRLYGAVGYKANQDVSLQFGFLKNHFSGSDFDRLQIGIFWNTDLRKKKDNSD